MATYTLQTPAKPAFKAVGVMNEGVFWQYVENHQLRFDAELKFIEKNCKVPPTILLPLMMACNYGDTWITRPAENRGLMGWDLFYGAPDLKTKQRLNANVVLNFEKVKARMSSNELIKLKSFGLTPTAGSSKNSFQEITTDLQKNDKFNLFFSAIFLGQLMDGVGYMLERYGRWSLDDSYKMDLGRILVVYLNGADTSKDSVQKALSGKYPTTLSLLEAIKTSDTYSYQIINRVLGTGGYLDFMINGKGLPNAGHYDVKIRNKFSK